MGAASAQLFGRLHPRVIQLHPHARPGGQRDLAIDRLDPLLEEELVSVGYLYSSVCALKISAFRLRAHKKPIDVSVILFTFLKRAVANTLIQYKRRIRNPVRYVFKRPLTCDPVVIAANDQGGAGDTM